MTSNPEYMKKWWAKNREAQLAVRRYRYANDAEYRAKVQKWRDNYIANVGGSDEARRKMLDARKVRYHSDAEHRAKLLAKNREALRARYRNDPVFREKERQRAKDRWKLKAQKA